MVELSEGDEDFPAAQINIGLFGVITEVTVKVKRSFRLSEKRGKYDGGLDKCLEDMMELSSSSEYKYVKFWVEFHNNFCVLFQTKETTDPISDRPSPLISFLTVSHCFDHFYTCFNVLFAQMG